MLMVVRGKNMKKPRERETLAMKRRYSITRISGLCIVLVLFFSAFAYQPAPALAASPARPAQAGPTDPVELGAFIDKVMASEMETNPFPGAAISVVKDGQISFQKGYGYADLEKQMPVDPSTTIFRIGSTTKLFTWTAVMQLVEQGKLDLEKDINSYLDFQIPRTFPQPITLKNLLTHTPGFEERNDGQSAIRAEDMESLGAYLRTHIPARVFPPGKIAAYSNYGAALAGYIVERASGVPFSEYVEKHIFTPLGMTHSTLRQPLPAELASDLSNGYTYAQGTYTKVGFEYAVVYPAGAASSTATDMTRFMLAHLQNGRLGDSRILQAETAKQMHSQLFTADPRLPGMAHGFMENSINGHRIISHGGDTLFFHSNLWLIPDQNTGIFVTTNGTGGVPIATMLIYQYMDHYYPVAPHPVPPPPAEFASRVKPYLGTYYSARGNFTTFEKLMGGMPPINLSLDGKGNLILSSGGGSIQLVEVEPGLLRDPNDANTQLVLHTDEAGQAYILLSDPWAYIKVPWYGTTDFRDTLVEIALLLSLASLTIWSSSWGRAGLARLLKRGKGKKDGKDGAPEQPNSQNSQHPEPRQQQQHPILPRLARWAGGLFGPVLMVLFVGLDFLLKSKDSIFGYPLVLLDKPFTFYILMALPYILAALGLLMLVFTVLAWTRRYWTWGGRLHYTLLTLSALSVLWGMGYWNLLF
jgi:CubicO group peptidase (beta-lactamase class C family)